jgi:hypothetical protein
MPINVLTCIRNMAKLYNIRGPSYRKDVIKNFMAKLQHKIVT